MNFAAIGTIHPGLFSDALAVYNIPNNSLRSLRPLVMHRRAFTVSVIQKYYIPNLPKWLPFATIPTPPP